MTRHLDGKPYPSRPEPGRLLDSPIKQNVKNITINKESDIDLEKLANAVAHAIEIKMPHIVTKGRKTEEEVIDSFDSQASLSKLADAMVVQREDSKSNFNGNLGVVKKNKKNIKDVDKTINILKDIGD